ATVLASAMGRPARGSDQVEQKPGHRQSVINFLMVVHGEQKVELHKPLPASGTFTAEGRTIGAFDKGKEQGGGDGKRDGLDRREGRKGRYPDRLHLRARRRGLRRAFGGCARAASG